MIAEGIIYKTCKEMDIEIIEIAVNPDHVHIFFKYPPKYSLSYIAKRIKLEIKGMDKWSIFVLPYASNFII